MAGNKYINEDLQNMCRLCFSTSSLVSIFDHRLHFAENMTEVIELTTGVKITPHDEISHMLCNKCYHLTIRMFKFRTTSILNDMDLREKAAWRKTMHKSVKDLFEEYPKLEVPSHIVNRNISPVVIIEQNLKNYLTTTCKNTLKRKRIQPVSAKEDTITENNHEKLSLDLGTASTLGETLVSPDKSFSGNQNEERPSFNILKRNGCPNLGSSVNKKSKGEQYQETNNENYKDTTLFTIKSTSKTLLVCDLCEKVLYTNKDLKKHRNSHMRCNLCRTEFNSMEKTKEHEKRCTIKEIMSNLPIICIEKCDEIKKIREKYSNAFEMFSVIEISDDECDPVDNIVSKIDEGMNRHNEETRVENTCIDKVNSGNQKVSEILGIMKSNFTETPTNAIINIHAELHEKKLVSKCNRHGQIKKSLNGTIQMLNSSETNCESDSGQSGNIEIFSNTEKSKELADPKTTKRKNDILRNTEMTNPNKSRKIENLTIYSIQKDDAKSLKSENAKEVTISNKFKRTPISDKPKIIINSANSENRNIVGEFSETPKEKNNSVGDNGVINIKENNRMTPLTGSSSLSREIEKSVKSKINEQISTVLANTSSSEKILGKTREKLPHGKSKEVEKSDTSITNDSKERSVHESEKYITSEKPKATTVSRQTSDKDFTQPTVINDSEKTEELTTRISQIKSSSVIHCVNRNLVECAVMENSEVSSTMSKSMSEISLDVSITREKSMEPHYNKKNMRPSSSMNSDPITNIEKPKKGCQSSDEKVRISIDRNENGESKVGDNMGENKKDLKKLKIDMRDHARREKNTLNHVQQSKVSSDKNSIDKTIFKPSVILIDKDALEVNTDDDDIICLKNLIYRIRKTKNSVERQVQTDLPSNSDIVPLQKDSFLYELKNLRNYLSFSNIPVTVSLGKSISVKYTYEPSSLMKNQSKLQSETKNTNSRNEVPIVKRKVDGPSQPAQNVKRFVSDASNGARELNSSDLNLGTPSKAITVPKPNPTNGSTGSNPSIVDNTSLATKSPIDQQTFKILNPTIQAENVNAVPTNTNDINSSDPSCNPTVNRNMTLYDNTVIAPQIINFSNNTNYPVWNYSFSGMIMQNNVYYQNAPSNLYMMNNNNKIKVSASTVYPPNNNKIKVSASTVYPPIETSRNIIQEGSTNSTLSCTEQGALPGASSNSSSMSYVSNEVPTVRVPPPMQQIPSRPSRPIRPMPQEISSACQITHDSSEQIFTLPRVPPLKRIPPILSKVHRAPQYLVQVVPNSTPKNMNDRVVMNTEKAPVQNEHKEESFAIPETRYIRVKNLSELK